VVVLGFSHSMGFKGVALAEGEGIETPLGPAQLDKETGEQLTNSSSRIYFRYALHGSEHSAENEIPFVQAVFPDAKMVVGLIGDHDLQTVAEFVKALGEVAKRKKVLVIASTDMLHDPDYDLVTKTDQTTLQKLGAMDAEGLVKSWSGSRQVFCGLMPVVTALRFAESQGCKKGTVLRYRNSGDDHPDSRGQWVVGYGAAVFAVAPREK
jgi:hypothetical protein